jgi:hypothetical protein
MDYRDNLVAFDNLCKGSIGWIMPQKGKTPRGLIRRDIDKVARFSFDDRMCKERVQPRI